MEKIRRKIRLFFVAYGKLLFRIIGIIVLIILGIQALNQYTILTIKEKQEAYEATREEIEQQEQIEENIEDDKKVISKFINYCNANNIQEAYKLISKECKENKYQTIKVFEDKYINKIFKVKKEYQIILQKDNVYKITLKDDILQAGLVEGRKEVVDYYTITKNILEENTISINLYNNI